MRRRHQSWHRLVIFYCCWWSWALYRLIYLFEINVVVKVYYTVPVIWQYYFCCSVCFRTNYAFLMKMPFWNSLEVFSLGLPTSFFTILCTFHTQHIHNNFCLSPLYVNSYEKSLRRYLVFLRRQISLTCCCHCIIFPVFIFLNLFQFINLSIYCS